ncbi:bifunctional phosphoglucose/phosphomannose isomerase [Candidatus Woesearchaeota archaeon]|nr:bifunctional phosphoglucose/phosphomannose isomerase [Candidatus Woesearchaeota archaeon]
MEKAGVDKENMYSVIDDLANQCMAARRLASGIKVTDVSNVIVTGMGGSAIAGDLLAAYLKDEKLPVFVNRDYNLPKFATKRSLVIVSSYSGNTEETVSAFRKALRIGCRIVAIGSGGKVKEICEETKTPHIKVPRGYEPRAALGFMFFPMLTVLENSKLISSKKADVDKTISILKKPVFRNMGRELAEKLVDKTPIIYSSERFNPVAMRWKTQLNENVKIHAFYNTFSEMNHNEIMGYVNVKSNYFVLILKDEEDHPRIKKRMTICKELIKEKGVHVMEVTIKGDCFLSKMFSTLYMGDWASYFLAMKYGIDPTPVTIIEDLKKKMG